MSNILIDAYVYLMSDIHCADIKNKLWLKTKKCIYYLEVAEPFIGEYEYNITLDSRITPSDIGLGVKTIVHVRFTLSLHNPPCLDSFVLVFDPFWNVALCLSVLYTC